MPQVACRGAAAGVARSCRPHGVFGRRARPHTPAQRRLGRLAPRAADQGSGEAWVAANQDKLRAAPLVSGALGVAAVVANRAFSGAVGLDASSAESRTDVIIIVLSAVLMLTGLQWLALRPVEKEPVELEGTQVEFRHSSLPAKAAQELDWAYGAFTQVSRCRALVAFFKGACIYHRGAAGEDAQPEASQAGPICRKAIEAQQGNYLANLVLYPGRFEFFEYLPRNTQGVIVQPIGTDGVLVAATDTQRGFGNIDQAWVALIAEKLDTTLDGYAPSGKGFAATGR